MRSTEEIADDETIDFAEYLDAICAEAEKPEPVSPGIGARPKRTCAEIEIELIATPNAGPARNRLWTEYLAAAAYEDAR